MLGERGLETGHVIYGRTMCAYGRRIDKQNMEIIWGKSSRILPLALKLSIKDAQKDDGGNTARHW
jgi:hypothetical protein